MDRIPFAVRPLFDATWSYREFTRIMPFGGRGEGQAYAYTNPRSRVKGERLSGELFLVQYPRWRVDETLLPDAHGYIRLASGELVMIRAAGYGVRAGEERRRVTHWMRFVAGGEQAWLNSVVAIGAGEFADEVATMRYVETAPAASGSLTGVDVARSSGMALSPLGTAHYEYTAYDTARVGDVGRGFGETAGEVVDGELSGTWRGWHYPTVRGEALELDAHAEIRTSEGIVLLRHRGVAMPPASGGSGHRYDVVQYATFTTEIAALAHLNSTLAVGVGRVDAPRSVTVSYYAIAPAD